MATIAHTISTPRSRSDCRGVHSRTRYADKRGLLLISHPSPSHRRDRAFVAARLALAERGPGFRGGGVVFVRRNTMLTVGCRHSAGNRTSHSRIAESGSSRVRLLTSQVSDAATGQVSPDEQRQGDDDEDDEDRNEHGALLWAVCGLCTCTQRLGNATRSAPHPMRGHAAGGHVLRRQSDPPGRRTPGVNVGRWATVPRPPSSPDLGGGPCRHTRGRTGSIPGRRPRRLVDDRGHPD